MRRRKFLKHATRTAIIPAMMNGSGMTAFARSPLMRALYEDLEETDRVLVLIYLGGGNDGLNTVVPLDQFDRLSNVRPDVILPENSLLGLDGLSSVKLHPALDGFRSLYNDGNLGIIQNVGYPNQNYSHFRSTDIWMTAAGHDEVLPTGWLGRYLNDEYPNYPVDYPNADAPDPLAIEIGYSLSVAFQGPVTGMGMVVADPEWFYKLVNDVDEPTPDTKAGDKLKFVRLVSKQSQVYGEVIKNAATRVTQQREYPDTKLGEQLKIVARLIAGGLQTRLYMVSIHGFDTHDSQVVAGDHTKGEHANLLKELGDAVLAFTKDLKDLQIEDRVMGATFSEFGRRIISNASLGTDHGAAAPMFVFGKHVNGGLYGDNPVIPEQADASNNLEMQYDFRSIYGTLLKNWFCIDENALHSTLTVTGDLPPIIDDVACLSTSLHEGNLSAGLSFIEAYPNPFTEQVTVDFRSDSNHLRIEVHDQHGRVVELLANGVFPKGQQKVTWNAARYSPGVYYIQYRDRNINQARSLVKLH